MNVTIFFLLSDDQVTRNMTASMLELDPSNYKQADDSVIFEKIQFLSSCGRRIGEIIVRNFQSQ